MRATGFDFWDNHTVHYAAQGHYSLTLYHQRSLDRFVRRRPTTQARRRRKKSRRSSLATRTRRRTRPWSRPAGPRRSPYEARCSASIDRTRVTFCAQVAYLDDTVGEFVAALKATALWTTLLWLMSDNGGRTSRTRQYGTSAACNWPLRGMKSTVFEGGVRVLSFVGGGLLPATARGTRRSGLAHSTDVFATLLRLGTVGSSKGKGNENDESGEVIVDGMDQWDMIAFGAAPLRTSAILSVYSVEADQMGAVIAGDLKLISGLPDPVSWIAKLQQVDAYWTCADQSQQPVPASGQVAGYTSYRLLFNVTADPEEKHNLVEAMPDEAANLQAILDAASAEAVPPKMRQRIRSRTRRASHQI